MIEGLKPYPDYKESGSPWLGTVPVNWKIRSLRTLIKKRAERDRPDLPLLSVAREKGVFVRSLIDEEENHNVIPADLTNYKVARAGNLVINKMKAWQGSMGIAPCDGIVSPAYFVFDFDIDNYAFGQALLRSKPYVAHFGQASDGVRVGQWDLSVPGMRQIPVLIPDEGEQTSIVRFLDHANGRIERAIRAKKKLIALLNEQKQAIVHRAVTRGLDPNVPLKATGIPWLGDIPKHWEAMPAKRICTLIRDGTHLPPPRTADGFPLLSVRNMINGCLVRRPDDSFISKEHFDQLNLSFIVEKNDVLMAIVGATLGKVAIVEGIGPFQIQRSVAIFRPRPSLLSAEFFATFLRSPRLQQHLWQSVAFSAQPGIYLGFVANIPVPLPPTIAEQLSICTWLRNEVAPLNAAIERAAREIGLLQEFRTRLTADVVTGKLDVRAAARKLPEFLESEAKLEAEGLTDIEPEDVEA